MSIQKSIFRYPGAKSSTAARKAIKLALPSHFKELRECFVGGGSTFFDTSPHIRRWINDLNPPLIAVYEALKHRPAQFIEACRKLALEDDAQLRRTFHELREDDEADPAIRYYVLNRCGFNGRVRLDALWRHRTFFSNPKGMQIARTERLAEAAALLADTKITCCDFEAVFNASGDDAVIFADPPYVRDTELSPSAKLYEKGFSFADHARLKRCVDRCQHKVVLTYDDHPLIHELYRNYSITPASWTYVGNDRRTVGRELIITNYRKDSCLTVVSVAA